MSKKISNHKSSEPCRFYFDDEFPPFKNKGAKLKDKFKRRPKNKKDFSYWEAA